MNRQRTTSGWPTGSPVRRDSFGGSTVGFDAASFGVRATSGARTTTPSGVGSRRRAGSPVVRGQPRKNGEQELEPRRPLRGRAPDCEVSFRGCDAVGIGNQSPSGDPGRCVGCLRVDPLASEPPFGVVGIAAEAPPSGGAGATMRSIPAEPFGDPQGRWRNAAAFGLHAPAPAANDLRVARPASTPEPDKAETLCLLLDVRVVGTPRGFTRGRKPSWSGQRGNARQHRNVSTQNPWEHRAVRSGNAAWLQRAPRWNKALRSAPHAAHRGNTRAVAQRTTRGHASRCRQPLRRSLAREVGRERCRDGLVEGCRGGESFEGSSP